MIGYMSLEEQVDKDFSRARHRAFFGRIAAHIGVSKRRSNLPAFEQARKPLGADNRLYLGRRVVEVSMIVGSVGRHSHFDRAFMPTRASMAERWKRVDRAFHRGVELPAVRLYKLGEIYFVEDGNHRVSVARFQGVEWIDAEVVVFRPRLLSAQHKEAVKGSCRRPESSEVYAEAVAIRRTSKPTMIPDPHQSSTKVPEIVPSEVPHKDRTFARCAPSASRLRL